MTTSLYPDWRWGMRLSIDRLKARQPNKVDKESPEVVTSSATYQDDDDLRFPVEANAHYFAIFTLNISGVTGADVKTRYSVPSGATGFKWCQGPGGGATDRENANMVSAVHAFTTERKYDTVAASGAGIQVREYVRVQTDSTAGEVVLQWAQNTSNATGTTMDTDSNVMWWRVG